MSTAARPTARGSGSGPAYTRVVLGIACGLLALAGAGWTYGVHINLTTSMPVGVYRSTSGGPVRGSTVLACLPASVARLARGRGYVRSGSCRDGVEPVGKMVVAAGGDSVALTAEGIFVNGATIPGTRPLMTDARGRALPQLRRVQSIVPPDSVWLYSPFSQRSFDSRYFGPVATADVVAVVRPVLVFKRQRPEGSADHSP